MIEIKQVDKTFLKEYGKIPMLVEVEGILTLKKVNNGLGGITFEETPVKPHVKDLGVYEAPTQYEEEFDISNWAFFMAFDDEVPIGGATVVSKTEGLNMLDGRDDMTVLWDIRVDDKYKHKGIGTKLFNTAAIWSRENGFKKMKIETQNTNITACKFYERQGCILREIKEDAYDDEDVKDEVMLIWYLDL